MAHGRSSVELPPLDGSSSDASSAPQKPHATPLLALIPAEEQLNLAWERINAFVSTDYEQSSLIGQLFSKISGEQQDGEQAAQKKQILFDVSGEMRPGELLAMMGPSGSGKTSLLSIIAGRAPKAVETRGRVTSGGARLTKAAKRRIGFVLQDDLLYESLTVWETLSYAAALRLPRSMNAQQRAARVEAVIAALGLGKTVDTIIGGFFRRGISGGERKRVSIGHELLINPALLLLDEPTSGLDSTTALHLLLTLKQLALGGRAIATTIHQPSSRLYQQLDRLLLLSEGHVVYYGPSGAVVPWFGALGFPMPYGVNVADFLLDLAQGEVEGGGAPAPAGQLGLLTAGSGSVGQQQLQMQRAASGEVQQQAQQQQPQLGVPLLSGTAAITALYSSYETFAQRHPAGFEDVDQLDELRLALEPPRHKAHADGAKGAAGGKEAAAGGAAGSFLSRSFNRAASSLLRRADSRAGGGDEPDPELGRPISRAWSRSRSLGSLAEAGDCNSLAARAVHAMGVADRGGASFGTQWSVLLRRSIKVKRFESLSSQRFWQGVAVAVITGLFWWQRGRGTSLLAASDTVGLLFFELLFPAFTAMFTALFTFPNDYRMLLKERASGMYRVSAFYLASTSSDLPMDCALPVLFVVIIYFMGGLRLAAGAFFANVAALILNVLTAQSLGLLLGAIFMNPKTAQTVASIIMLGFMLVGGYYVRGIPAWISWLRYLSFVFWGFNLLLKIEFAGSSYVSCGTHGAGLGDAGAPGAAECTRVPNLQAALQLPTDPNASPALEIGVLFAMLLLLRLGVYVTLRHKTKSA